MRLGVLLVESGEDAGERLVVAHHELVLVVGRLLLASVACRGSVISGAAVTRSIQPRWTVR